MAYGPGPSESKFLMYGYYGINLGTRQGCSGIALRGDTAFVGIGTGSPTSSRLQVSGGNATGGISVTGTIPGVYVANQTLIDNASGTARFFSTGPDTSTRGKISFYGSLNNFSNYILP